MLLAGDPVPEPVIIAAGAVVAVTCVPGVSRASDHGLTEGTAIFAAPNAALQADDELAE